MTQPRLDDDRVLAALDDVAARGARVLRVERRHRAVVAGLDALARRLWIAGAGAGLVLLGDGWAVAGLVILGVGAAAALLALANGLAAASRVDTADALARLDAELGLEDRLLTARDFLGRRTRTGFMQAAVEDAAAAVETARAAVLRPAVAPGTASRDALAGVASTLALIVLAALLRPAVRASANLSDDAVETARVPEPVVTVRPEPPPAPVRPEAAPEPERRTTPERPGASESASEGAPGAIPEDARETRGATGEGRSAEASASQGAGQSKGVPSAQGQVSVPDPKERKSRPRKDSKEPDATPTPQRKPEDEQKSGSTAGSGAASGSNRNPSTSEWSSKDQVSETDDDPVEDDSDVDDEDSDSEARGGLQPNLRDRRPPVNRDLSVGFGNEPDEEANGRGGPSQAKKSRGTASLVLGVPVPDHVKGQPNAGRTKITQERVEPQDDDVPQVDAAHRGRRRGPSGHVARPVLAPWMRALVRAYFLSLHEQEKSQP